MATRKFEPLSEYRVQLTYFQLLLRRMPFRLHSNTTSDDGVLSIMHSKTADWFETALLIVKFLISLSFGGSASNKINFYLITGASPSIKSSYHRQ